MKFSALCLVLAPFLAVHSANITVTPPEYDPESTVCPGNCVGTYTHAQFAAGACFGTVGICLCEGTQDSPPLGDLKSCLEGSTCSMSAADTETYISGLLAFEGCTVTSTSVHLDSGSTSTSGRVDQGTGLPSGPGQPGASTPSKPDGALTYSAQFSVLLAFGATFAGAVLGTLLI
ncbi:hypothetical protein B0H19DRAFT_1247323 [Mycena capillaripes]|nr:hypothetical protein B0H19DRAFT_1247323 [Mycena capillaripes]